MHSLCDVFIKLAVPGGLSKYCLNVSWKSGDIVWKKQASSTFRAVVLNNSRVYGASTHDTILTFHLCLSELGIGNS